MSFIIEQLIASRQVTVAQCEQAIMKFRNVKNFTNDSSSYLLNLLAQLEDTITSDEIGLKVCQLQLLLFLVIAKKEHFDSRPIA